MRKLVIYASPVLPMEIFEMVDENADKINSPKYPREAIDFIKNYADKNKEETEVIFMGPKSYVQHYIDEANKIEYVLARWENNDA